MPPSLAVVLTVFLCVYLVRRIGRDSPASSAHWIPIIWIFFIGSRFPAQWLQFFDIGDFLGASYEEGTPLDAAFFLILILVGARVLVRRGVLTSSLVRENLWLSAFLGYCLLAILWSDFPFVAFKRWIKILGHPVMALIILTDPRPTEALRLVFQRCSAVMLMLSVLFVKYLPQYGRMYDPWTGEAQYRGINLNKNELGYCCLVFGLYSVWALTTCGQISDPKRKREE